MSHMGQIEDSDATHLVAKALLQAHVRGYYGEDGRLEWCHNKCPACKAAKILCNLNVVERVKWPTT